MEDPVKGKSSDNEDCVICLDTIKNRGLIECCEHKFCFDCIINWSKVTNKCPVCKRDFHKVTAPTPTDTKGRKGKAKKPKVVKVKSKVQRSDHHNSPFTTIMTHGIHIHDIMAMIFSHTSRAMLMRMSEFDDELDSDYIDGEDEDQLLWWPRSPMPLTPPDVVRSTEIIENGVPVIEILDDDEGEVSSLSPSRAGWRPGPQDVPTASTRRENRPGPSTRNVRRRRDQQGQHQATGSSRSRRGQPPFHAASSSRDVASAPPSSRSATNDTMLQSAPPVAPARDSRTRSALYRSRMEAFAAMEREEDERGVGSVSSDAPQSTLSSMSSRPTRVANTGRRKRVRQPDAPADSSNGDQPLESAEDGEGRRRRKQRIVITLSDSEDERDRIQASNITAQGRARRRGNSSTTERETRGG